MKEYDLMTNEKSKRNEIRFKYDNEKSKRNEIRFKYDNKTTYKHFAKTIDLVEHNLVYNNIIGEYAYDRSYTYSFYNPKIVDYVRANGKFRISNHFIYAYTDVLCHNFKDFPAFFEVYKMIYQRAKYS